MSCRSQSSVVRPGRRQRLGSALYITVAGTTMIVAVLGMASLSMVRIERKQASTVSDRLLARSHARSGVELALKVLNNTSNWRSTYSNGVETAQLSLGSGSRGTVSWKIADTDGSLTNSDTLLRLKGIGRVGDIVQVSSVAIRVGETATLLRKYESFGGLLGLQPVNPKVDDVKDDKRWGQAFRPDPSLPTNANGWRITSIEIKARTKNSGRPFNVNVYRYDPVSSSLTLVDSTALISSGSWNSMDWRVITMPGSYWLNVTEWVCIGLESTSIQPPIEISWEDRNGCGSNAYFMSGKKNGWENADPNRALQFRANGAYSTSSEPSVIAGSWEWDSP